MTWAGTEPVDVDAHEGCECLQCCPPCAVDDCWEFDVTARLVSIGYGAWCRLLLCDQHGRRHPYASGSPFSALGVAT